MRLGSMLLSPPLATSLEVLASISPNISACGSATTATVLSCGGGGAHGGGDSLVRWPTERLTLGRHSSENSAAALSAHVPGEVPTGAGGAAGVACAAA